MLGSGLGSESAVSHCTSLIRGLSTSLKSLDWGKSSSACGSADTVRRKTVAVAISGGVDSAVAAHLLKAQG